MPDKEEVRRYNTARQSMRVGEVNTETLPCRTEEVFPPLGNPPFGSPSGALCKDPCRSVGRGSAKKYARPVDGDPLLRGLMCEELALRTLYTLGVCP